MKYSYFLLVFLIFQLCFIEVDAQNKDSIKTQHIDEVIVTAQVKPSIALSSNPIQVLSESDIDKTGVLSISDAIRRFSGVVVKDFGGIGGMKTVAIRGVGSEHTAVLYDGIIVSNAQSGQVDIGRFSLDNIAMLSLTIGQSDDIFRTAKASASVGVLSITTREPSFTHKKYSVHAQLVTGSWGQFNPYLYYAYKLSNKFSFSLDGSWQRADGEYSFKQKNASTVITGKRQNTDVDIKRTELNVFGELTKSQELSVKVYYFDSERGLPGAIIFYNNDSKERLWDRNFFTQAKYINTISDKFNWQLQGKYGNTYTLYMDKNAKYPNGILEDIYKQDELYLTSSLLYNPDKAISFSLAQDYNYNTLTANYSGFAEPDRSTSLTSLSAKYDNKKLTVIANLLGTYITEDVVVGNKPDDRKRLSPSVSFSYRPFNFTGLRIRASYKDIFRVPSFNDLYYIRMGNTSLRPEKTQQYNVGLTWTNSFSELFNYFSVSTDVYRNDVKDKIVIYPAMFESKVVNLGEVKITGLDFNTNARLVFNNKLNLEISGNYTYQKAIDITDPADKNNRDQIPYTPEHSGAASLTLENPWVNFGYSFIASGKTYAEPQNIDRNRIEGFIDHTITLNRTFERGRYKFRVQGDIANLSNKTYYIIKDYPMPGRSYRILLRMNF
ncbi:outer membrane cobalamin receptor [Dysgonomonas alginatilytica]|uniref:Outer membrane cobalamin receptor n=1 Tax=Dysgonomonas alginatilytica TaxID=1605892 RepID=A0A2V3PNA7_9BACT|nr:TonB-dependent receptor [Dysgonomonas alginatilytica]PXV64072.1 outer membrane cobalamin receptor [Dysgonomonas alginatilytica]